MLPRLRLHASPRKAGLAALARHRRERASDDMDTRWRTSAFPVQPTTPKVQPRRLVQRCDPCPTQVPHRRTKMLYGGRRVGEVVVRMVGVPGVHHPEARRQRVAFHRRPPRTQHLLRTQATTKGDTHGRPTPDRERGLHVFARPSTRLLCPGHRALRPQLLHGQHPRDPLPVVRPPHGLVAQPLLLHDVHDDVRQAPTLSDYPRCAW
mmetsp:Transcript_32586/g.82209  ORF Transcript_32586/g.82209 Transcript_32586/m.82209 type:complete len:207 (-) Transcript_32586:56-676(-)